MSGSADGVLGQWNQPLDSTPRVAILLSGRGSNFDALQAAVVDGRLPVEVVLVVSNVRDAAGLETARQFGVPTLCVPHREYKSRRAHERVVLAALVEAGVDWVCLAGYMRLVSKQFVDQFAHRILNIHPSLLPSFAGLEVHEQALQHGVKITGCTVHLVDHGLDSGPIVAQTAVPVIDGDTVSSLAARVLQAEHDTYWRALEGLVSKPWRLVGRRVEFDSP